MSTHGRAAAPPAPPPDVDAWVAQVVADAPDIPDAVAHRLASVLSADAP